MILEKREYVMIVDQSDGKINYLSIVVCIEFAGI